MRSQVTILDPLPTTIFSVQSLKLGGQSKINEKVKRGYTVKWEFKDYSCKKSINNHVEERVFTRA